MRRTLFCAVVLAAAVLLLNAEMPSYGQQRGKAPLERRVEVLEDLVRGMQRKIAVLEAKAARGRDAEGPAVGGPAAGPGDRPAAGIASFDELDGHAVIIAADGTFLGLVSSDAFAAKSIANEFGNHGSDFSRESIFNDVGPYGGEVGRLSPWNPITTSPPKVFVGETFVGFLTKNELKRPRIDPDALVGYLKGKE